MWEKLNRGKKLGHILCYCYSVNNINEKRINTQNYTNKMLHHIRRSDILAK